MAGLNERLITGEDAELGLRPASTSGFKIFASPQIAAVHLRNPKTLGQFFREANMARFGHVRNVSLSLPRQAGVDDVRACSPYDGRSGQRHRQPCGGPASCCRVAVLFLPCQLRPLPIGVPSGARCTAPLTFYAAVLLVLHCQGLRVVQDNLAPTSRVIAREWICGAGMGRPELQGCTD